MEVCVFPLGEVVFYPSTSKPLNIFEPKYIQMVRDSVAMHMPIALAYVDNPLDRHSYFPGSPLTFARPVAGIGHPLILETRPDGTMMIFLQGAGKVKLKNVVDKGTPYIICEAELLNENHSLLADRSQSFFTIKKVMTHWIYQHIPDPNNREQFLKTVQSPEEVVGCFASYLVKDHDLQQLILEHDDINEKVGLIEAMIGSGELLR